MTGGEAEALRGIIRGSSRWWSAKIGLEIHAQVTAASKLFSISSGTLSQKNVQPNECMSLFDAAIPGTLPRLNRAVVQKAIRAATAFNCEINHTSYFERKHYFYQDLPLGYQITQQRLPIAQNGSLEFDVTNKQGHFQYKTQVRIERIQIEQDSGKSLHNMVNGMTLVDLNRAGIGLLEIVFSPDLKTPMEASSCLRAIQKLLRHIGVCDGNMQNGSMRCDVNVSVREHKDSLSTKDASNSSQDKSIIQGSRVEVKNINSINSVNTAAAFEINRHISLLENDNTFDQQTRGYDDESERTFPMRMKETAVDYRIFPDPDIPSMVITDSDISEALENGEGTGRLELPEDTISHIISSYHLDKVQAERLLAHPGSYEFFEKVWAIVDQNSISEINSIQIYNWMMADLLGNLNANFYDFTNSPVDPSQLCTIIHLVESDHISALTAKKLIKCLFETEYMGSDPDVLVEEKGWKQITDESVISQYIEGALSDQKNMKKLQTYQSKNSKRDRMASFFFGEVMRMSKGQASPKIVKTMLEDALLKTLQ